MLDNLQLHTLDWLVIALAITASLVAGLTAQRKTSEATRSDAKQREATGRNEGSIVDYVLAGRRLTVPLFAASLIATWYGSVLGAGEFVARYGMTFIVCFGVPYYVAAVLYALFLSKRLRRNDAVSVPDLIRKTYGSKAGYAAAAAMLFISIPAPFMLSLGLLLHGLTGISLALCVVIGTIVALFIVAKGGLGSDVRANVVQVTLMFSGFIALAVFCVIQFGAPTEMWATLPSFHQFIPGVLGWQAVAVWFLIALQTFVDPNFHVRTAAARTPETAQRGLMLSVVGWMIFDGLQLIIGLYAVAYAPSHDPLSTFLTVANTALPTVWKGLFLAGVFSAVMATLDGYALVSATTIGHDIIDATRAKGHRRSSLLIGLVITGVIGTIAAIAIPSIVDLIYKAASVTVPALLLPVFFASRKSLVQWSAVVPQNILFYWIAVPACASLSIFGVIAVLDFQIEPMLVGIAVSVVMLLGMRVRYGRTEGK